MRTNTERVRYHSSDDMTGVGELATMTEPVAVVLRQDGSVDAYGSVGVIDQRRAPDAERLIELLSQYGRAKFGDEWWPACASDWIGYEAGQELQALIVNHNA